MCGAGCPQHDTPLSLSGVSHQQVPKPTGFASENRFLGVWAASQSGVLGRAPLPSPAGVTAQAAPEELIKMKT